MWSGPKKPIVDKSSIFSRITNELATLPHSNKLVIQSDKHIISISNDGNSEYTFYDANNPLQIKATLFGVIELATLSLYLDKSYPDTFVRYIRFDENISLKDAVKITLDELKLESKSSAPKAPGGPSKTNR